MQQAALRGANGHRRFVLSSAVCTRQGLYEYRLLPIAAARRWLTRGDFESAIGYDATAQAMDMLLSVRPSVRRAPVHMGVGDEALIFRLRVRVTDPTLKHRLTPEFVAQNVEIGLLRRLG